MPSKRFGYARGLASLALTTLLLAGCAQSNALAWPNVRQVTLAGGQPLFEPAWSPDGKQIAVVWRYSGEASIAKLEIVDAQDGTALRTHDSCSFREPHWSPDGTQLLVFGCDGLQVLALPSFTASVSFPYLVGDWSGPNHQYALYDNGDVKPARPASVALYDEQGAKIQSLYSAEAHFQAFGGLAWSHAAGRIAFSISSLASPQVRDIQVVREDGSGLLRLSNNKSDAFDPSWSPDGQWLVYISVDQSLLSSKDTLIFSKADGTCSVPALSTEQLTGVDWSPDGQHLAVTLFDELYIVDIAVTFGPSFAHLDSLCAPNATPS